MGLFGGRGKKGGSKKGVGKKPAQKKSRQKRTQSKNKKSARVPNYPVKVVKELPKNPQKGIIYEKTVKGKNGKRKVGFVYTGKTGFGKWKIVYNKPA